VDQADQVGLEHGVDLGHVLILEQTAGHQARVVDQNVDL